MKITPVIITIICSLFLNINSLSFASVATFTDKVLIAGSWGENDGEFGKETLGKTEDGYAIDFAIYNNAIEKVSWN